MKFHYLVHQKAQENKYFPQEVIKHLLVYWGKTGKQIDIHSNIENRKEKKIYFNTTAPEVSISEDQEIVNILPKQR